MTDDPQSTIDDVPGKKRDAARAHLVTACRILRGGSPLALQRDEFEQLAAEAYDKSADPNFSTVEEFTNEPRLTKVWYRAVSIVALLWALFSIIALWIRRLKHMLPEHAACWWLEIIAAIIVTTWAVLPPLWFYFDPAFLLEKVDQDTLPKRMARWKRNSAAAKAAWIAVGTLIAGLYIKWEH